MLRTDYTRAEIVRLGEEIYERNLRTLLEPENTGKFLVLDIQTADYEIDANEVAAIERARAKNPQGVRYIKRIGFASAHRLGGKFVVHTS